MSPSWNRARIRFQYSPLGKPRHRAIDPVKDMAMVSMVTSYPFILNVPAQSPFASFSDLLGHARRNPGALNYASSGVGSTVSVKLVVA